MKLIEISEEEFDGLYIAEKLNYNIKYDNLQSIKYDDHYVVRCHYYEIDNEKELHIKMEYLRDHSMFLDFIIPNNLNGLNSPKKFYICLLKDSEENREILKNLIDKYELEYIDRREKCN